MINIDDTKIVDYLRNELSDEERVEIENWLEENEENRTRFKRIRQDEMMLRWGMRQRLVVRNYAALHRRIKIRRIVRVSSRYAAVFLLAIFSVIAFNYYHSLSDENNTQLASVKVHSSHAYLKLSSGEIVNVGGGNQQFREQDGTFIEVTDEGSLKYTKDSLLHGVNEKLYNTLVVPRGGEYDIILEDGTHVYLNSASELRYPSNFGGKNRSVYLKGEGYFDVAKDAAHPFIVHVNNCSIKVYGTEFNINTYKADRIQTVLVSGKISFTQGQEEISMEPGEKVDFNEVSKSLTKEKVDVDKYIAWRKGIFVFENDSLEDIMNTLSLWYDLEVFFANEETRTVKLSGEMERFDSIEDILYFFEQISNVKFKVSEKHIVIENK